MATEYAWANHGKELTAHTIDGMGHIIQRERIRRLETVCLASRRAAQIWYKRLGLVYESTLKGYAADGTDAVMFVKVES